MQTVTATLGTQIARLYNSVIVAQKQQAQHTETGDMNSVYNWQISEGDAVEALLALGVPVVGSEFTLQGRELARKLWKA